METSIIATAIKDLETCHKTLELREKFIQESLIKIQPQTETAWWQEPEIIISGTVVSFGLGVLVASVFLRR